MTNCPDTVNVNGHTYFRLDKLDQAVMNGVTYVRPHFPGSDCYIIDGDNHKWVPDGDGLWVCVPFPKATHRSREGIRQDFGIRKEHP